MPTRIAFASCCKIDGTSSQQVQPAWKAIEDRKPDLLLLLGDNVYMKQTGPVRWNFKQLDETYARQFAEPHFASCIKNVPFMATWDDHDFGPDDSRGATQDGRPNRLKSRNLFHKYMADSINNNRPYVYCSHVVGDVKIILLDGRYYRTDLLGASPTILGTAQEKWLAKELQHDRMYTVVGCGSCLTLGGKTDNWSAYQAAYGRLLALFAQVPRLLYLSGDIHRNRFVSHTGFHEAISSGIGRDEDGGPLDNHGWIEFTKTRVNVQLRGRRPKDVHTVSIRSKDWQLA